MKEKGRRGEGKNKNLGRDRERERGSDVDRVEGGMRSFVEPINFPGQASP